MGASTLVVASALTVLGACASAPRTYDELAAAGGIEVAEYPERLAAEIAQAADERELEFAMPGDEYRERRFYVTAKGDPKIGEDVLSDYALRRAAEATLARGFSSFVVVLERAEVGLDSMRMAGGYFADGSGGVIKVDPYPVGRPVLEVTLLVGLLLPDERPDGVLEAASVFLSSAGPEMN